jgi:hypothetical protein
MENEKTAFRPILSGIFGMIAAGAAIVGLLLSGVGYFLDARQFLFSWLTALVYWTTIGLGALFFVMLHHLVGARWSTVLRRMAENLMWGLPVLAVFFLPILFHMPQAYSWSNPEVMAGDHLLTGKSGYLNVPFFTLRLAAYFLVWFVLVSLLNTYSNQQDTNSSASLTKRMRVVSAAGMVLFAVTLSFAAFDWLMSLDAHWYSTIYGVYVFAGSFLALLALMVLIVLQLRSRGILKNVITSEHDHDLGKLLFAFTIFWGYMAFSQYLLIWYGNIPEETVWFLHRWNGTWKTASLVLIFGQFVVPFFVLFPQAVKRMPAVMKAIGLWILLMHWVDIYWLVMPSLHHEVHLSWMDVTTLVGIGGVFLWFFQRGMRSRPLVPINDPTLAGSIRSLS